MKITSENLKEIITLREQGTSNKEIAAKYNINITTLHYWLRKLRASNHQIPRRYSPGRPRIQLPSAQSEPTSKDIGQEYITPHISQ